MCYFLYISTKREMNRDETKIYNFDFSCGCHLFHPNSMINHSDEIRTIVSHEVEAQGEVTLVKTEGDIEMPLSKYPIERIDLYNFLTLYPGFMKTNVAYSIRE